MFFEDNLSRSSIPSLGEQPDSSVHAETKSMGQLVLTFLIKNTNIYSHSHRHW